MAYNNDIPLPGDLISVSQGQILGNFAAIDSGSNGTGIGFSRNHVTMTDGTNGGLHFKVDFYQAIGAFTLPGVGSAYPATYTDLSLSPQIELVYRNSATPVRITNNNLSAALGQGMMPGGLQLRSGSSAITDTNSTQTITFLGFPTNVLSAQCTPFNNATVIQPNSLANGNPNGSFVATRSNTNGTAQFYWLVIGY